MVDQHYTADAVHAGSHCHAVIIRYSAPCLSSSDEINDDLSYLVGGILLDEVATLLNGPVR